MFATSAPCNCAFVTNAGSPVTTLRRIRSSCFWASRTSNAFVMLGFRDPQSRTANVMITTTFLVPGTGYHTR